METVSRVAPWLERMPPPPGPGLDGERKDDDCPAEDEAAAVAAGLAGLLPPLLDVIDAMSVGWLQVARCALCEIDGRHRHHNFVFGL